MKLLGFQSIPCSRRAPCAPSTRSCLARSIKSKCSSCRQASLGTRDHVTLDIDATVIHAKKKTADRTYKGKRGFTPMVGHIAETGQVLHAELRKGNVPPSARNVEFFKHCIEALPEGVRVAKFRADAASWIRPQTASQSAPWSAHDAPPECSQPTPPTRPGSIMR